jgi:hypothetical protein
VRADESRLGRGTGRGAPPNGAIGVAGGVG